MKLIVEMEMPESCRSCKLCVFIGSSPVRPLRKYPFDTVSQYFYADKKPTYCPIKGVLPEEHGDLIDRDAMLEKYNVKGTNIAECLTDQTMARAFEKYCIIADAVEAAETVIAAERKDDE